MSKEENNIEKIYLLTPMQEGMLFHSIKDESNAYFTQLSYSINGQLDINIFSKCVDILGRRHDILRTAFVYEKTDKPVQIVLKKRKIALIIMDKSFLNDNEYNTFLDDYKEEDIKRGFDLVNEPLIRLTIFQKSSSSFDFLWSYHHILLDGWCHSILIEELDHIYNSLINKKEITLPLPISFGDYVNWLTNKNLQLGRDYWKNYLKGYDSLAEIPKIINGSKKGDVSLKKVLIFNKKEAKSLETIAKDRSVTLNEIFQSIWGLLLAKYSNTNDVVYGNVVSGRPAKIEGMERCLGLFINTIPIRLTFEETDSFIELTNRIHEDFIDGLSHHYNSLADIQNDSILKRDLIKHVIAFENYPLGSQNEEGTDENFLKISNVDVFDQTNYDFDIDIEIGEKIEVTFYFDSSSYSPTYVENLIKSFRILTEQFITNPDIKISDLVLLSEENINEVLHTFNKGEFNLNNNKPINVRFEEQVLEHQENIAIIYNEKKWSFNQLNEKSNQIANLMIEEGVQKGDFLGLFMNRAPQLIASLMAIFKVGAVYVPLDTQNPLVRTMGIIEESQLKTLISTKNQLLQLEPLLLKANVLKRIICLDAYLKNSEFLSNIENIQINDLNNVIHSPTTNPENQNEMESWAYMLYTSGSTGKPKGAITRHNGALNHILAEYEALSLPVGFRFLQSASIASDISVWQMLAPLLKGGSVVISDKEDLLDYEKIITLMSVNEITIAEFVPSYLIGLVDYLNEPTSKGKLLPKLQWMMMVGEEVPVKLVNNWLRLFPECKVLNGYGPCEASDDISQYIITKPLQSNLTKVPIGTPIANMNIFVLNKNEKLVPVGVQGEICVSGVGVGAGYFGELEKTNTSFKKNPFKDTLGDVMYKTGDLGRWMPDGNLEFLGRIDRQVKIRGNRVELGEIEAYIYNTQLVKNIHIVACKNSVSSTSLLAFLVLDGLTSEVINKCQQGLPSYMQPTEYCIVEKIPYNLSDKVDEKTLLETYKLQKEHTKSKLSKKDIQICKTETEKQLKEIWEKTLNKNGIGASDNFFEQGGHSLLAMRVKAGINKKIKVNIDIRDLFIYVTLDKLAAFIDKKSRGEQLQEVFVQERPEKIPLSYAQESIWFIDQLQGSAAFHIPAVLRFKGLLDSAILNYCLKEIVNRHEVLKSVVKDEEGMPYQEIIVSNSWDLEIIDKGTDFIENELEKSISNIISKPFDLAQSFKLRATLIRESDEEHILVLVMHHIASDGWSESVLVDELMTLYAAKINGRQVELPKLPLQYVDYAIWQHKNKQQLEQQISYWKNQLNNVSTLELPTDFERPKIQSTKGASIEYVISSDTIQKLKKLSLTQGATMFMTLLAAFKVLIYRYTGQNDICVGIPIAGRTQQEFENLIGFFVNTLAIRSNLKSNPKFVELLHQVKNTTLDAYKYQDVPFEKVVEVTSEHRDLSRNPLFQVMFTLQNTPEVHELVLGNLKIDQINIEEIKTNFDIHFNIEENPKRGVVLEVEYCSDLFSEASIDRMIEHYQTLLDSIISNIDEKIDTLEYITLKEKNKIINEYVGSSQKLPEHYTIPYLFGKMVEKHPNSIAIIGENSQLSYTELNNKANRLANLLIYQYTLLPEETVGIIMSRGTDFIVAMLAVLKSGCCYMPIDVNNVPLERIEYQLEKANAKMFITDDSLHITSLKGKLTGVMFDAVILENQLQHNPKIDVLKTRSLAYIMFTSGSSGEPKGVLIEHRGVIRLVKDTNYVIFSNKDKILQTGSLSFDASTFEVWGALLNGGQLHLMNLNYLLDSKSLSKSIKEKGITKMWFTSSWFNQLVDINEKIFSPLEQLLVGGEQLSPFHIQKVKTSCPQLKITNGYGPTENTTFSICGDISNDLESNISLGRPITNSTVYILDKNLRVLPKGIPGELLLGGEGISRGYVNNEDKTKAQFISHPFIENEFLYRSGDIGKWMEDGRVEFMGRIDDQIKINGYRLEPGEIAHTLMLHSDIKEAIVNVMKMDNGEKVLISYFTSDKVLEDIAIRSYLENILPSYMVPVFLYQIENIPINENGKVNKKLLPPPSFVNQDNYQPPINEQEKLLINIWSEMLGLTSEDISVTANFFALGGHSLLAMRVISRIQLETGKAVDVAELFNKPTIRQFSKSLSEIGDRKHYQTISKVEIKPFYEVSQAQKRVWIASQISLDSAVYNITSAFEIRGNLNMEVLKSAIFKVLERHEILRTNFIEKDGIPYQVINDFKESNCDFEIIKTKDINKDFQLTFSKEESHNFNLEKDTLIRFRLLTDNERYIIIVNIHHIIGDGWSFLILQNDILAAYQQLEKSNRSLFEPLNIQYKDYTAWHNMKLQSDDKEAEDFWLSTLQGVSQRSDLPTDKERSAIRSTEAKTYKFKFSSELSQIVNDTVVKSGAGHFVILQTLVKIYLSEYLNSSDIVIGTPIAGRNHPELEDQIGFYVNMLALRSQISKENSFQSLINQIALETQKAFQYQLYPYNFIINKLEISRDLSRNELFDVVISYMDGLEENENSSEFEFVEIDNNNSNEQNKYDITFSFETDSSGIILAAITYNTNLFFDSSIKEMKNRMLILFEEVLKSPTQPLVTYIKSNQNQVNLVDDFS